MFPDEVGVSFEKFDGREHLTVTGRLQETDVRGVGRPRHPNSAHVNRSPLKPLSHIPINNW